jgi:hypothetical protein
MRAKRPVPILLLRSHTRAGPLSHEGRLRGREHLEVLVQVRGSGLFPSPPTRRPAMETALAAIVQPKGDRAADAAASSPGDQDDLEAIGAVHELLERALALGERDCRDPPRRIDRARGDELNRTGEVVFGPPE